MTRAKLCFATALLAACVCVAGAVFYVLGTQGLGPVAIPIAISLLGGAALVMFALKRKARIQHPQAQERTERLCGIAAIFCGALLVAMTRALPAAAYVGMTLLAARWLCAAFAGRGVDADAQADAAAIVPAHVRHVLAPRPILDNASGLLAAGLMFVLSYGYLLESFKIPTGSMEPTLYGHPMLGDRAFVNKLAYRFGNPKRGDICIFRYPLRRSTPYVKRCAGLSGEFLLIAQGDVFVQGADDTWPRIWRKEGRVRESMWLPYYEFEGGQPAYTANFKGLKGNAEATGGVLTLTAPDGHEARARYPREGSMVDRNPTGDKAMDPWYGHESVQDMRVRCRVVLPSRNTDANGAQAEILLVRGASKIRLVLSPAASHVEISLPEADNATPAAKAERAVQDVIVEAPQKLDADGSALFDIDFAVADGAIDIAINGATQPRITFETPVEAWLRKHAQTKTMPDLTAWDARVRLDDEVPDINDCHLEFAVGGNDAKFPAKAELHNLSIERDIHYLGIPAAARSARPVTLPYACRIPADSYFMLGDNSEGSEDSRLWCSVTLQTPDGDHVFDLSGSGDFIRRIPENQREQWRDRFHTALRGVESRESLADVEAALLNFLKGGGAGATLRMADNFDIQRVIAARGISSVKLRLEPFVPAQLLDGQMMASIFPNVRFVD